MDKALLDTDIFSEVLKRVDPNVATRAASYLIIYRPETDPLEIVHVLHGARDVQAILGEEP